MHIGHKCQFCSCFNEISLCTVRHILKFLDASLVYPIEKMSKEPDVAPLGGSNASDYCLAEKLLLLLK